jgi:ATP-dependent Clp protease ATP-binding subunit ClpC
LLGGLKERLAKMGITLVVDETAENVILDHGFDPEYGARPLKRTIAREVEDLLSNAIIAGELKKGDCITIYGDRDRIRFAKI